MWHADVTTVCRASDLVAIRPFLVPWFFLGVVTDKEQGCVLTGAVASESDSTRRGGGWSKGIRPYNAGRRGGRITTGMPRQPQADYLRLPFAGRGACQSKHLGTGEDVAGRATARYQTRFATSPCKGNEPRPMSLTYLMRFSYLAAIGGGLRGRQTGSPASRPANRTGPASQSSQRVRTLPGLVVSVITRAHATSGIVP